MRGIWPAAVALLVGSLVSANPVVASAQTPPQAEEGLIWRGAYTAPQAEEGATAFAAQCARCHRPDLRGGPSGGNLAPPLAGDRFLERWESDDANKLFRTIRDTMPRGSAGSLGDAEALVLVAFLLKSNGFPAGAAPLPSAGDALARVVFLPKAGAAPRTVEDFSLVRAVGCLAPRGDKGWALERASNPVVARETAAGQAAAAAAVPEGPLGTQTLRLIGAGPFKLDGHRGERARVTGVIRRDPAETLVNLTGIEMSGAPCAVR